MSKLGSDIVLSLLEQSVCDLAAPKVLFVRVTRTEGCFAVATYSSVLTCTYLKVYMFVSEGTSVAYQSVAKTLSYKMVYSTSTYHVTLLI